MRIHLDTCAWKRPYDRPASDRVALEAFAVVSLLRAAEGGRITVVSSSALEAENSQNPDAMRRAEVAELLARMPERVPYSEVLAERARELRGCGLTPLDALYAASAEAGGCDYLVTTDDRMLRTLRRAVSDLQTIAIDPLGLVRTLEVLDK